MNKQQEKIALLVLVILHVVGLIGLNVERFRSDFVPLIWINLVFIFCIVLSLHSKWNRNFLFFILGVFAFGITIEALGVRTDAIFGAYSYKNNLGFKIASVPFVIGLNWVVLTYCTGALARKLDPDLVPRVIAGAILMVGLDALIEPFAIRYELWEWTGGHPPFRNYIGWLVTAAIAQVAYHKLLHKTGNPIAVRAYIILVLFFAMDLLLGKLL